MADDHEVESSFIHSPDFKRMVKCEELIDSLNEETFDSILKSSMDFLNSSCTHIFARTLLSRIYTNPKKVDFYLSFLKKHDESQTMNHSQVLLIPPFVKALFHQQVDPNMTTRGLVAQSCPQFIIQKLLNMKIIDRNQLSANDNCLTDLYGHQYDATYFMHLLDISDKANKQLLLEFNQIYMSNDFIRRNFSALSKNNFELHKKFVNSGANPDPISLSLRKDNLEKFKKYISTNPIKFDSLISTSIYESNRLVNKCYLIEFCAFFGSVNCFKYLLEKGAKITEQLPHYAIAGGNQEIIDILQKTPGVSFNGSLKYAIAFHRIELCKWLFESKHDTIDGEALSVNCIFYCSFNAMKTLLLKGCNPSFFLESAAQFNFIEVVKMFLQMSQIQPDIVMNGCTPLIYAAMNNNFEMARILIELGNADINFTDSKGTTALHYACKKGNIGLVKYLLENPMIYPDVKADVFKFTPLSFACIYNQHDIVDIFLEREDINFKAAMIAIKNSGKGNLNYLLQKLGMDEDSVDLSDSEEDI
ncbi:hypothetical protein TRFO_31111 [Tritrichomonas foetus]|uniref:DUF3447 domain-containing protein n=1 Tax=Tritrichomonas foetus TaxID=1144522 RepID=A0A1J4JXC1_9EUKA|nr:hypothetical protein TRFO_31111 [Tritrichomonas foetus]|eukprot:OHT01925.1 hypothetical protein TRFO_31111 [Tritrichomonas foetus]